MLMAMARLDLPAVYLYGGTILPGTYQGRDITIQDVFEAVGAHAKGTMSDDELLGLERAACPTTGSCAGMYTANTMAAVGEALGMSLPGSASPPAVRLPAGGRGPRERDRASRRSWSSTCRAAADHDEGGVRERDRGRDGGRRLDERGAASARDRARGARGAGAGRLRPRSRRRVPHLVDVRPAGRFVMSDLDRVGGVPVVMKELLDLGPAPRRRA